MRGYTKKIKVAGMANEMLDIDVYTSGGVLHTVQIFNYITGETTRRNFYDRVSAMAYANDMLCKPINHDSVSNYDDERCPNVN